MDVETLRTVALIGACGAVAFFLMGRYRGMIDAFLRRDKKTLRETVVDGLNEQELNEYAKRNMFGSPGITTVGRLIVFGITLLFLVAMLHYQPIAALLAAYIGLGMVITARKGVTQNELYPRLTFNDRLVFRILHGTFWPWYFMSNKNGT